MLFWRDGLRHPVEIVMRPFSAVVRRQPEGWDAEAAYNIPTSAARAMPTGG
jgi:hypothetical protein